MRARRKLTHRLRQTLGSYKTNEEHEERSRHAYHEGLAAHIRHRNQGRALVLNGYHPQKRVTAKLSSSIRAEHLNLPTVAYGREGRQSRLNLRAGFEPILHDLQVRHGALA